MIDEKEQEIWISERGVYIDENNIIYITAAGEADEKRALEIKDVALKFLSTVEEKVNIFIDINKAKKQSPEARKIWEELNEHEKIGRIALFGLHPVSRVLASFFMGVTKKRDMGFFKTKEEALAWLKEGK